MSLQGHLAELERRHQAIEKEIETQTHRLSSDDLRIVELKRKKLHLKDEIQKLKDVVKAPSLH
jgi:hypothetical protein